MERPYKFAIFCHLTRKITETNEYPVIRNLQTWVATDNPNIKKLEITKTGYIDTRYKAKLRLYNYITYTRKGLPIPRYKPFEGTEIGKSIPILNF